MTFSPWFLVSFHSKVRRSCRRVIQNDSALKVRFCAMLGEEEPEVELSLAKK